MEISAMFALGFLLPAINLIAALAAAKYFIDTDEI
jgi:hypothetical protein